MRDNLAERIANGEFDVESLSEDEQQQLLQEYNAIAKHWLESPKPKLQNLAREILALLEDWIKDEDSSEGKTLH